MYKWGPTPEYSRAFYMSYYCNKNKFVQYDNGERQKLPIIRNN